MLSAVRAEREDAVDGIAERAVRANDFGLKLLLAVVVYRRRATWLDLHREPDAKGTTRLVIELQLLEVFVKGICDLAQRG